MTADVDWPATAANLADELAKLRGLLARYVEHVAQEEGTAFLHEAGHRDHDFTAEDAEEVQAIHAEFFPQEYLQDVAELVPTPPLPPPRRGPVAPRMSVPNVVDATDQPAPERARPLRRPKGGPWAGLA